MCACQHLRETDHYVQNGGLEPTAEEVEGVEQEEEQAPPEDAAEAEEAGGTAEDVAVIDGGQADVEPTQDEDAEPPVRLRMTRACATVHSAHLPAHIPTDMQADNDVPADHSDDNAEIEPEMDPAGDVHDGVAPEDSGEIGMGTDEGGDAGHADDEGDLVSCASNQALGCGTERNRFLLSSRRCPSSTRTATPC